MKKIITNIFALSLLVITAGCSGTNDNTSSRRKKSSLESSESLSSSLEESSSDTSSSSSKSSSSSRSSSSSSKSSSSSSQVSGDNKLSNDSGLVVEFSTTGASISKITWNNTQIAKDGFVVGRCANRIANGQFTLNGEVYNVDKNNNGNSLHGGNGSGMNNWRGPFATGTWKKESETDTTISFSFHSNDGAQGYPGNMDMTVTYTLNQAGELSIEYSATTDKDTLCNPTNHLYMNLNGSNNRNYNNVKLMIDADEYTPLKSNQIPTGDFASVEGTKYDYRTEISFKGNESYDDNYVLNGTGYRKVASMTGDTAKIKVDVYTDRPGLQLYNPGSGDICLETQMMPDAINQPKFEDPILRAGTTFTSKTTYAFSKIA